MLPSDEGSMSAERAQFIEFENTRRVQVQRISQALKTNKRRRARSSNNRPKPKGTQAGRVEEKAETGPGVGKTTTSIPEPPFYSPAISDERCNEITAKLCEHYDDLALATMYFEMHEHVLLSHILALKDADGNIAFPLEPNEWRAYLINCEK